MGAKQKVSLPPDMVVPLAPIPHNYSQVPPPPPKPPAPVPHADIPVPTLWPPGFGMGQNQFTATVKHKGLPIASEGHDCGVLIPHIPMAPPLNVLLALIIPFSSRKMMFSASTVPADGKPIGTSDLLSIPTPMMTCGDPVSLPTSFPLPNAANTVNVGMTGADFALGAVSIAGSIIADVLSAKAGPKGPSSFSWGSAIFGKLVGGGDPAELLIKAAVGMATDSIKVLIKGEGSIDVMSVGSPFGQFKVTVTLDKKGKVTAGWELSGASPTDGKAKTGESATLKEGDSPAAAPGPTEDARSALVGGLDPL